MKDDKFKAIKSSYQQLLLQKDTELDTVSHKYWLHILNRDYVFNKRELVLKELESMTLEDVVRIIDQANSKVGAL